METAIDVIMPVYNTPKKDLDLCFNSIINQTFCDWRLLVIDDGSINETANQLDEWMKRDKRIEIHHYKNGGPSVARNRGIALLKAPYFIFIDSDDILAKDFLSHGYKVCTENNLDLLIGSIELKDDSGKHLEYLKPQFSDEKEVKVYTGDEVNSLLDYAIATCSNKNNSELKGSLLARLYPKIICTESFKKHDIRLENNMFCHEDNIFSFDCLLYFHRVGVTEHIYYQYIKHPYSIVHRKITKTIYNEEIRFIESLKKRESQFLSVGCEAALANRYLLILSTILSITSLCDELDINQAYNEFDELVGYETLCKMILPNKYPLQKKEKIVFQLIKLSGRIRKRAIFSVFLLNRLNKRFLAIGKRKD